MLKRRFNFCLYAFFVMGLVLYVWPAHASPFPGTFVENNTSVEEPFAGWAFFFILGTFYGMLTLIAFYNLWMFFTKREELYLYFVLFVVCSGLVSFAADGSLLPFLLSNYHWLNTLVATVSPVILLLSFTIYSIRFLDLKNKLPKFKRILDFVMYGFVVFFLVDFCFLHLKWSFLIYLISFMLIYLAGFTCLRKGYTPDYYYISGFFFMFMSLLFWFTRMGGGIHCSDFSAIQVFNIGIAFEIAMLSLSLVERIKLPRQLREATLEKLIVHLRESDRLKDNINLQLEMKVKEGAVDLKQINVKLDEGLKQLEYQAGEIKRLNQLLNIENTTQQVHVKEMTKARVLMQDLDFLQFRTIFPEKDSCYKYLSELKWKNGYKCKKCEHVKFCDGKDIYSRRCTRCRYDESATAYTIFHRLKFPIAKAFHVLFLVYANKGKITSLELSQILSLRQSTCWSFNNKIIEAMKIRKKGNSGSDADGWSLLVPDPNSEL